MGYTHYWYRPREIEQETFNHIAQGFQSMLPAFRNLGIKLAGYDGCGEPIIHNQSICFNGSRYCGHTDDTSVVIPWPADDASGIALPGEDVKSGSWFAGVLLQKRVCNGDCSYETFYLPRIYTPRSWDTPKNDLYFGFCKTAFRPYDLAVTSCLIIVKHYLKDKMVVHSDGEEHHWQDAKWLCQTILGYGADFHLDP